MCDGRDLISFFIRPTFLFIFDPGGIIYGQDHVPMVADVANNFIVRISGFQRQVILQAVSFLPMTITTAI